jgi:hypothetical protein
MTNFSKIVILVMLINISYLKASATNYYINDNSTVGDVFCSVVGNALNAGTSPSQPKRSLREIWTLTGGVFSSGDIIYVDAGTYARGSSTLITNESNFSVNSAGLTIQGAGNTKTVFDNDFYSTNTDFFIWVKASNFTLKDVAVLNYEGGASYSGGTYKTVNNGAQAISIGGLATAISGVLIENVLFNINGGSGNATLTISQNTQVVIKGGGSTCNATGSTYSGGIDIRGNNVNASISNYVIAYNQKSGFDGAGLYIYGDNTTIVNLFNSTVANNVGAQGGGAGIYINGGNVTVRNCIIRDNTILGSTDPFTGLPNAYYVGAGVAICNGTLKLAKSKIQNNTSPSGTSGAAYGGVGVNASAGAVNLTIDSCSFLSNSGFASVGKDLGARINNSNKFTITINESSFSSSSPINIGGGSTNSCTGNSFTITRSGNPVISYSGSPVCLLGGGSNTLLMTQTFTPSPISFTGTCGTITLLPVEFLDFSGACQFGSNALHWSTASEHNNAYFTIERAGNDGLFTVLATIQGSQTTTSLTNYDFQDIMPLRDVNYYRLSQTDVNGDSQILKTISVDNNKCLEDGNGMFVFADQSGQYITIDYPFQSLRTMNIEIYNSIGQLIETQSLQFDSAVSRTQIHLRSSFSNGMYFLKLSDSSEAFTEKFMIRKQ